ncbi:MAG: phosphoribosylamine--glycine ligase [Gemmatimonadaceae bacterium]
MKVLIVGGGGREHAITWKLHRDDPSTDLVAAPGNPGIAELARCVPVGISDLVGLTELARAERPNLVVVGPEAPLADGLADRVRSHGIACFGPSRAAAQIEASKRFAKECMLRAGVPTGSASWHTDADAAKEAARAFGAPVVIKASGLAAGKGVVVCAGLADADSAIDMMLRDNVFGSAGAEVLVEEFMEGEELSVFFLTDGTNFCPMLPVQDHKRLGEHESGPNTGGMGAYAPVSIASTALVEQVGIEIVAPLLADLRDRSTPFTGLLYVGLMLTPSGPKVVEFNCRFGDPETEVVLPLMRSPLLPLLVGATEHDGLAGVSQIAFSNESAVTVVVASSGYPEAPVTGVEIRLPEPPDNVVLFHAGTKRDTKGVLRTSGGRVFAATGIAATMAEAHRASTEAAGSIAFEGAYHRRDIGWRETARDARTT